MDGFENTSFDVVVIGTGLVESITARYTALKLCFIALLREYFVQRFLTYTFMYTSCV